MSALTEAQRVRRRQQARDAIEKGLRDSQDAWGQTPPRLDWAADIAVASLGELAAEILVDGTMMRSFTLKGGVPTLELEPASEILTLFVAAMRGFLGSHRAENYVETEVTFPSVSMDVGDGAVGDAYTLTVQRRSHPTPHGFRQRAERERDTILRVVSTYVTDCNSPEGPNASDLVRRLEAAGFPLPDGK